MVSLCPALRSNAPPICLNTDCIAAAESSRTSAARAAPASHRADSRTADAAVRANVLMVPAVMMASSTVRVGGIPAGGLSGDPLLFRHACEKTHSRAGLGGRALLRGAGAPRHALGDRARPARQPCDRGAAGRA